MEHTAGLVQGIRGAPAPMVKFLLDTSAAFIESIPGQVHDVEGVHDRGCVWEFFSGGALEPGESIHRDDLDVLAPRGRLGGRQVLKTPLDRPGTMSNSREGPLRSWTGVTSKMTVTYVSPYGVWRHTCSSTPNDTHPLETCWIIDQQTRPFSQDNSVGSIPGHAQGLGDARHRHMMNNHARQRPAHRRTRELRTRIGRLTHVLTPHVSTLWAPVAANAHMHDRGTPPAGFGGVWLFRTVCFERVVLSSPGCLWPGRTDDHEEVS